MAYPYRYLEDRASLPSTSSSSTGSSSSSAASDTGESARTSTSYDERVKLELPGEFDDIRYPYLRSNSSDSSSSSTQSSSSSFVRRHPLPCLFVAILVAWIIGLHIAYPFPTTIPVFVGAACGLFTVTAFDYYRIINSIIVSRRRHNDHSQQQSSCTNNNSNSNSNSHSSGRCSNDLPRSPPPYSAYPHSTSVNLSRGKKIRLALSTALILFFLHLGIVPPAEHVPVLHRSEPWRPEKYFIAANLYNNADVFGGWSAELLKLCDYLGHNSTFVSIYESNSDDATPALLHDFSQKLTHANIPHRIVTTVDSDRQWSYGTSSERIQYLANARNKAIEPLQSENDEVRLPDWNDFTRVVFLNDVIYSWKSVVRLIATRMDEDESKAGEYDLACGLDFSISGLYDTWVARDVCGTPFRIFWPYAKDPVSIDRIRQEKPTQVGACWNGVVVFPAGPYLYKLPEDGSRIRVQKRSWKMIDNSTYPGSVSSPPLSTPLKFRSTGIEACDHSECFLFSYDLHRIHNTPERPPRILINPSVKTAYQRHWYRWHNTVLRIPMISWWHKHWSRGYPLMIVDFLWEFGGRRRDYCTWAGLNIPDRCPKLPGAWDMSWNEG